MANKNSSYVNSLVSFIKDTKPYHSKLTEIIEEYRFSDEMSVNIKDRVFNNVLTKAAWMYSHFANGISNPAPSTLIHRILTPQFRGFPKNDSSLESRGAFKVQRDENTDLPLVPYAFDPKAIDGVGLADAFVQRDGIGTRNEALLEGHDVFLSHGAYVFQIKQTVNTQSNYAPQITERRNENLISTVTAQVQMQALDLNNPSSAINRIQIILDSIDAALVFAPDPASLLALADVQAIIDTVNLPQTYEALINALKAANIPQISIDVGGGLNEFVDWDTVGAKFSEYSTSLYFNAYTDLANRESAGIRYNDIVDRTDVIVANIIPNPAAVAYEEFTLEAITPALFYVRGSESGIIGSVTLPGSFSNSQISFDVQLPDTPDAVSVGTEVRLTPAGKISVHADAALEAWSIIKVNPLAYSRPLLSSTRYGYLTDGSGEPNSITILDSAFPASTVIITALSNTTFSVTNTAEPAYYETCVLNTLFNDGRLEFTVRSGSAFSFEVGDKFFIEIQNAPPEISDLDLYYGYDMGPYSGDESEDELRYNTVNSAVQDYLSALDFGWDSRFVGYDLPSFDLQITQSAVTDREWRLRALPNLSRALQLQNGPSSNVVNQIGTDDAENPDAAAQFDMPNDVTSEGAHSGTDPDTTPDLALWYADVFSLEYNDNGIWTQVATVPVGSSYSNPVHGLSFNLVPASKPFIASRLNSSYYDAVGGAVQTDIVEGGDVIYWRIKNDAPFQVHPAGLVSPRIPRLVMHGDSYHNSIPGRWTATFTGNKTYSVQGYHTTGVNVGQLIAPAITVQISTDGHSFRNDELGLHWTVVEGNGLAAPDSFSFETFASKPSFLVHGSVSGWQPDAEIDKWYWNGKIGFKIKSPSVSLFENNFKLDGWMTSLGAVTVQHLRFDSPSAVYEVKSLNDGRWTLYRDGRVVGSGENEVQDSYIKLSLPTGVSGTVFKVNVQADDFAFALGHDLAIVRTITGRMPGVNDFVLFSRTKNDTLNISVKAKDSAHAAVLAELAPRTIELQVTDHNTGSGVPLSVTSPETAILQGWIPALIDRVHGTLSPANFSDTATHLVVRAAASGETIGTVQSIGSTPIEPVMFQWDEDFTAKYLPLNAEATIVTLGSGMNDLVHVNISEGITFLLSGGGLAEDALFADTLSVGIIEGNELKIKNTYGVDISVAVSDGPFGGFLPGYDNLPFDLEDGLDGYYDAGQVLTAHFVLARELALKNVLTPQEQATYNDLLGLIGAYTSDPGTMTLEQFIALLDADPALNSSTANVGFGIPSAGHGIQIEDRPEGSLGTAVTEAAIFTSASSGYSFDQFGYDVGAMDVSPSTSILMCIPSALSQVVSVMPTGSYADYSTELFVQDARAAQTIELLFTRALNETETGAPYLTTPDIYVWYPDAANPMPIPTTAVERNGRALRFTVLPSAGLKFVIS